MKMERNLKPYYIAFDVSTTCTGIALFDDKGKLAELTHIKLDTAKSIDPANRYLEKSAMFRDYIKAYKEKIEKTYNGYIKNIFVEEPLKNGPNIDTVITLARFNGIVCYLLNETFGVIPSLYDLNSIRKTFCPEFVTHKKVKGVVQTVLSIPSTIDKKEYIWKRVTEMEKGLQWLYTKNQTLAKENFDMTDAYACGYHGLKTEKVI